MPSVREGTTMIHTTPCDPASLRVTVLEGGVSDEREVSLRSGKACAEALAGEGFAVEEVDTGAPDAVERIVVSRPDVVFIALHGKDGEDGCIQGLCEILDVPYTGSGVLASALAMEKTLAKETYRSHGIPTAPWLKVIEKSDYSKKQIITEVGVHVVVKPACEGSALGVRIVKNSDEVEGAIEEELGKYGELVVERYIEGTEVTVGVLGAEEPEALPVIEIVPQLGGGFYDYEAKYAPGGSKHIIPARIGDELTARCQELSVEAHEALGCYGVSRTDIIIDKAGECWVLETNTIPGMTETSLLPHAAAKAGVGFGELCRILVELALMRGRNQRR